ncbi:MAG TPA: 50S ribosomal protein L5, partial [Candidatus Marinimicrobia bacterium]|nr:50S ribosomal protein L5 [Candidatus Neomarinimicrobiota bacterium]
MAGKNNTQFISALRKKYKDEVIADMMARFKYSNIMEVPHITQISINMGIGDAKDNPKKLESAIEELTSISCQKPVVTKSRKDISNFKIRKGFPVGCKVTLRGTRMYDFLQRLISIALPRTRDFRG